MDKKRALQLIRKIITGTATPEEEGQADRHFQEAFYSKAWDEEKWGKREDVGNRISSGVNTHIDNGRKRIVKLKNIMRYAAAVAVFVCVAALIRHYSVDGRKGIGQEPAQEALQPGSDIASLELGDGTVLDLADLKPGENFADTGFVVTKTMEGYLSYVADDEHIKSDNVAWNTLRTPRGGRYQMVLADGTKVWLNAGSSISFPSRFTGDTRVVTAAGEVYFEVAHDDRKPFLVNADGFDVQVVGTSFNLSTYQDRAANGLPTVALVEGAVRLDLKNGTSKTIAPGQKAFLETSAIGVEAFDVEAELAWKDNYFLFKEKNIKDIMDVLARWYDADVRYVGDGWEDRNFTIKMSRHERIAEVLSIIELTESVGFKMEGKEITVHSR